MTDWLTDQQLSCDEASCFCWTSNPFPKSEFPEVPWEVRNSKRRFHHYFTLGRLFGAVGKKKRAKLPKCVTDKIAKMYPDEEGAPTKVGYKQDPEE